MDTAGLAFPPDGRIAVFGSPSTASLHGLDPERCDVIHGMYPEAMAWQQRGVTVLQAPRGRYAAAIVTLPRAKDLAEAQLAQAANVAPDLLVVDGAKTDGIERVLKALRGRTSVQGVVSKAHGKCLWLQPKDTLKDWAKPERSQTPDGDWTAPGVFSADGVDPGSHLLATALPDTLKGHWADLGAGWGWLSREVLLRDGVKTLHLVEADRAALDCAQLNVTDPRAQFHWNDALTWTPPGTLDGVVMNPPFHTGRKADPALGRAFVTAAARVLAPHGGLWMVANRHLPYETTLQERFREVAEIGGDTSFKLFHAARPKGPRR